MTKLLSGLQLIGPKVFHDTRGYFYESYQVKRYQALNLPAFVQDNVSYSKRNVVRGLHYQLPDAQGKLVYVAQGEVWDVIVDIRKNSPTFSHWCAVNLNDQNHYQLYIPPGFAHGFCVLSESAIFHYKCSAYYNPQAARGIAWDDPNINITWPITNPILSDNDQHYALLNDIPHDLLFT